MDKYRVTLTAEERDDLDHAVSVGKAAARKLTCARLLLLADTAGGAGHSDEAIVAPSASVSARSPVSASG